MSSNSLIAKDILELLEARHSSDIGVAECKTGPTHGANHRRMDFWAMPRSWAHPSVSGYEIKVSRSDFLKDDKWPAYLPYCNLFYFVCPWKLIAVEEVPEQAGLLWASKTGTRLFTKLKAPHRDVQVPESLFRYILMARSKITSPLSPDHCAEDMWREWLRKKESKAKLGYRVRMRLNKLTQEKIDETESRMLILERRLENFKGMAEICSQLEIDPDSYGVLSAFENRLNGGMKSWWESNILQASAMLERVSRDIQKEKSRSSGEN